MEKNPTGAARLFRLATEDGNPRGPVDHGLCYRDGIGLLKNEERGCSYSELLLTPAKLSACFTLLFAIKMEQVIRRTMEQLKRLIKKA